ncbi:MAG: hypothetical protein K2N63_07970 [Lachnospiraceae bacterium]|nr:hypothetical protein [Lachnospiraceae bacterium]
MADTPSGKELNYTPILPFDITAHEDFSFYDRFPYIRDISLFDNNIRMMNRGNIIRYVNCKVVEPKKIGGDVVDSEITAEEDVVREEGMQSSEDTM